MRSPHSVYLSGGVAGPFHRSDFASRCTVVSSARLATSPAVSASSPATVSSRVWQLTPSRRQAQVTSYSKFFFKCLQQPTVSVRQRGSDGNGSLHVGGGDSCLHSRSQEGSTQTMQGVYHKRLRTYTGLTIRKTPRHGRGKNCSKTQRRNSNSDGSKWHSEDWEDCAMECYCNLRNVHEKMSDGNDCRQNPFSCQM